MLAIRLAIRLATGSAAPSSGRGSQATPLRSTPGLSLLLGLLRLELLERGRELLLLRP
jgi:hypothetical protein